MPFRVFAAGEVLTAANVNDYLAEQAIATFAGTAARASAITAPTEGQFAYLSDSDSLTFYNGSAWVNAGSAIAGTALSSGTATSGQVLTANGSGAVTFSTPTQGLTLINTTSFSAVASQSVNNVFTSTYTNYRVLFRLSAATADTAISLKMRASGTDKSANYYYGGAQGIFTASNSTWAGNNVSSWDMGSIDTSNAGIANAYAIDFFSPVPTVTTIINMQCWTQQTAGNTLWVSMSGVQNEAVTCDGFSIISSAGNISGVVRVYGYND